MDLSHQCRQITDQLSYTEIRSGRERYFPRVLSHVIVGSYVEYTCYEIYNVKSANIYHKRGEDLSAHDDLDKNNIFLKYVMKKIKI